MPRLFYLLMMVVVSFAALGCTAPAWWLADNPEADDRVGSETNLRAGSAIEAASSANDAKLGTTSREAEEAPFNHNAMIEATLGGSFSQQDDGKTERRAGRIAGNDRSPGRAERADVTGTPSGALATESLDEQVHGLGFADPREEASALAALRAAPPEHRKFLLRTMQASARVRQQQEERQGLSNRRGAVAPAQLPGESNGANDAIARFQVGAEEEFPTGVQQVSHHQTLTSGREKMRELVSDKTEDSVRSTARTTDWQSQLAGVIAALAEELAGGAAAHDRAALEAKLRLLQLIADRRDEAVQPRSSRSAVEQEFWSNELYGLATLLDSEQHTDAKKRAALAATHLRQAADRLAEYGGLAVKNLHFCTEVKGYGSFVTFPDEEFSSGQEVLLYCEVENFKSELREKGYHTALKARYEVFNASGERVAEKDLGLKDEHCQNRRRDFFVPYFISMPKQVTPGKYQLKLTLEDVHAGQTAEAMIEFEIKGK
jgi:hypothetical protein